MKLKFDSNLEYQNEAMQAVVDLFEGMPPKQSAFEISLSDIVGPMEMVHTELGVGNRLILENDQLLKNLHEVQEKNNIPKSRLLIDTDDTYQFVNYSIEMETGTGKTYVYLRTIFELNRKYGFKKFIIVVPSVAIREGVLSSIDLMREHFKGLYDKVPFDHFVYNSSDLPKVRQFAVSNEIQIMIITIQSFQKDAGDVEDYSDLSEEEFKKLNVIHKEQDKMSGHRPIEFVQATNPIVIIDEPQSVDTTPKAKHAIKTLSPLFCLRYSATHINPYNLLYSLDPIRAYDMRLVKQIEVASICSEDNFNEVFIRIDSIGYAKDAKVPHAKATIHEDTPTGPREKRITLRQGTDISQQTNRPGYDGFIVTNICAEADLEHVEFANSKILELHQEEGGLGDEVLKAQLRQTVEEHFKKEKKYKDKGIKVLSLFFIDRVANYRWYDDEGNPQKGKLAEWFEEAFTEVSQKTLYSGLLPSFRLEDLHDGYFSADKRKGQIIALKDTSGSTKADEEVYELIMKNKEQLLSMETPLRFIFSHSALKEGWDNPNVFQICSLREMGTERERRQTLGRGLRLPVDQNGDRIYDDNINKLTVIASETFEEYAKGLQADIESDVGGGFKFGRIEQIAFARLIDETTDRPIGQEASKQIWEILVTNGYLDNVGDLTTNFNPEKEGFRLELPTELEPLQAAIIDEMKRYIFRNRIVDARERRTLKYNKRIELNEDFKLLWQKINKKTRYSVEFETDELIALCVEKIGNMEPIQPVRIFIDKTEVDISAAGVERGRVLDTKTEIANMYRSLPDILAFLQRETELTRNTLVEIMKQSGRLLEFKINPQAFMTETAKLINRALHEMVVDGIKYEQIADQYYEMRLFEEKEIEEYLTRLYEVQSNDDRTPYDYIVWDSGVEREIAEKLDTNERIKFFCKLPRWFVVPTPLGDYNPDWAVVMENDERLYLVRETKSTHDRDDRRQNENRKIECGKAHFHSLGVNFKIATNIQEVLSK